MKENIQWTVQVQVNDGQLETAKALANEMSDATRSGEPGAVQYEWFFSEDGKHCHILEEYRDSDAAVVHLGNFLSKYVERFMGCFTPTGVYLYGSPSGELKDMMTPFGPVYLSDRSGFVR